MLDNTPRRAAVAISTLGAEDIVKLKLGVLAKHIKTSTAAAEASTSGVATPVKAPADARIPATPMGVIAGEGNESVMEKLQESVNGLSIVDAKREFLITLYEQNSYWKYEQFL